jgi:hypothetical protein
VHIAIGARHGLHRMHSNARFEAMNHSSGALSVVDSKIVARSPPSDLSKPAIFSGLILGTACNVEHELPGVLVQVERIASLFNRSAALFFEADSTDRTRAILSAFVARLPSQRRLVTRNTIRRLPRYWNNRVARIAYARQRLLKVVRVDPYLRSFQFMVVMDLDAATSYVDVAAAAAILRLPATSWGVATANQRLFYYDRFALRMGTQTEPCSSVKLHVGNDGTPAGRCRQGRWGHGLPDGLSGPLSLWGLPYWWRIPSHAAPINVKSAFGGLAIYRTALTAGCSYEQDGADCEHVTLHACMRWRHGARVVLFPSLLVAGRDDRYLRHSLALLAKLGAALILCLAAIWTVARRCRSVGCDLFEYL